MRVLAILGTAALLLVARGAPASKIFVSTTGDDANDGLSWATAKADLGAAFDVASSTIGADTIHVAAGIYDPNRSSDVRVPANVALLGGYPPGGGTARDPRVHSTVLSTPTSYAVQFDRNADRSMIDGFIIRRSLLAILVDNSGPLIRDCIIEQNAPGGYAPGLDAYRQSLTKPPLRVEDCVFRDNAGHVDTGGRALPSAIFVYITVASMDLELVLSRTVIEGNSHAGGVGVPTAVSIFGRGARLRDVALRNNVGGGALQIESADMTNVLATEGIYQSYNRLRPCIPSTWRNITTPWVENEDCSLPRFLTDSILWGTDPPVSGTGGDDLVITNSIIQGGWPSGTNIIDADPLFVPGPEGDFYLSEVAAGQATTSPGVDAGSVTAAVAGLDTYTTRTDSAADAGMVDLGYHPEIVPIAGLNVRRGPVADGLSPYRTVADLPFTDSEGTLTGHWFRLLYYDVPGSAREIIVLADRASDAVRVEWR